MDDVISDLKEIVNNRVTLLLVFLVAFISYSYLILNPTVNIDDTALGLYYQGGELIAQSRFGTVILAWVLHLLSFRVVIVETLAVCLLIVAGLLWCVLLKRASADKLHPWAYTVFALAMLSYPLISEFFIYQMAVLPITLSYLLTAVALLWLQTYFTSKRRSLLLGIVGLVGYVFSMIESFAPVFIVGFLMMLVLEQLDQPKDSLKRLIHKFLTVGLIITLAIVIKYGVTALLISVLDLKLSGVAATDIYWLSSGFVVTLRRLVVEVFYRYFLSAIYYFPITMFVLSVLVGLVTFITLSIQKRNRVLMVLYAFMLLALFSLAILQGSATPYRASQALAVFVAFILMVSTHFILTAIKRQGLRTVGIVVVSMLVFYQVNDLNHWFHVEKMRHDEETMTLIAVSQYVEREYGFDKPIVFTGEYELSDHVNQYTHLRKDSMGGVIYGKVKHALNLSALESKDPRYWFKYTQTSVHSFINWGMYAFSESNGELIKYIRMLGFDVKEGNRSMVEDALQRSQQMPKWPQAGSVTEQEDYILVHF